MPPIRDDDFSKLEYTGWQRVADQYLGVWSGLTKQYIDPLLDAADVKKGMKVLDVACGPGIVSKKIKERGATQAGIDFSPQMISIARRTYPDLQFLEGDAQQLPFDDKTFDRVVMNFGMLHLPDPLQAMKEACRVLRSKGRFAFTVWAGPTKSPVNKVMTDAKNKFADMNVPMPAAPAYDKFEDPETCRSFLHEAGFDPGTFQYENKLATWLVPTAEYLFEAELNAGVRNAAFLKQQSAETLQNIKTAAMQGMQQFKTDEGYLLPFMGCIIAAGKK